MKFRKKSFKPNYSYWLDQNGWTRDETVCLLLDIEPIGFTISFNTNSHPLERILYGSSSFIRTYNDRIKICEPKSFHGKFLKEKYSDEYVNKFIKFQEKNSGKDFANLLDSLSRGLFSSDWSDDECQPPKKVITWAKQKGIRIPSGLEKAANKKFPNLSYQAENEIQLNITLNYKNACIKLATHYWSKNPKLTISELARKICKEETLRITFDVKKPKSEKTIRKYIEEHAPSPSLGRPRKDTSSAPNLPKGNT